MAKLKILCSFINPEAAKEVFGGDKEKVESENFFDDMKAMDPNFDESQYREILDALKR